MKKPTLVVVLGPTGSGKTDISIQLAKHFNSEILSADSRQMFREMPIGSAIPNKQQLNAITHHFIGSHSIHDYYNVGRYEIDALQILKNIFTQNNIALLVGGSGLYIDAVCRGIDYMPEYEPEIREKINKDLENNGLEYILNKLKTIDPEYYQTVDKQNAQRVMRGLEVYELTGKTYTSFRIKKYKTRDFNIIKLGITLDREILYQNINQRVDNMIEDGMETEAKQVYPHRHLVPLKTIGYREWFQYFDGDISREKAIELIKRNSRHYARRQMTWFKRYDDITWFDANDYQDILNKINKELR